jgi:hypothetical protein
MSLCNMNALVDGNNKLCAYLYNNKIILPSNFEVVGVVLGDCVFGYSGDVKGKIFKGIFYAVNGQIVAREEQCSHMPGFDVIEVVLRGWHIVQKIKNHECSWITPSEKWVAFSIEDFLKHQAWVTVLKRAPAKTSS